MTDWRDDAACRFIGPEIFYPTDGSNARKPKQICATCPVRLECLEFAMAAERGEGFRLGIWGGTSPKERAALSRQRGYKRKYQDKEFYRG